MRFAFDKFTLIILLVIGIVISASVWVLDSIKPAAEAKINLESTAIQFDVLSDASSVDVSVGLSRSESLPAAPLPSGEEEQHQIKLSEKRIIERKHAALWRCIIGFMIEFSPCTEFF